MLGWMVEEKAIAPHVPVWDKTLAATVRFRETTFVGTRKPMSTAALVGTRCAAIGVHFRTPALTSRRLTPSSIEPVSTTAADAR